MAVLSVGSCSRDRAKGISRVVWAYGRRSSSYKGTSRGQVKSGEESDGQQEQGN